MMVSDEEKRWLVVGIAMNKIAAPVLRDFIKQGMDTHYSNLDVYCSGLATPCTLKTLTYHQVSTDPCFKHLKFQNINNNLQLYGMKKKDLHKYNYNINSSVDLAKLFLPDYLAEFSGFDESLDMSAILRLLGFNKPAPIFYSPNPLISIQLSADDVRENVRNTWGHCNVTDWTEVFFSDCFSKTKTLVRSLGLTPGMEKMALDKLSDWETKGCQLCMGHAVDHNLLSLVQQDVKLLIMDYKTTEESLAQQRGDLTAMQNTVTFIQDQQSATGVQLEEHDEQLAAVLEWKEQQMKENEEILVELVSVEKILSEELLIRVEGVEKGLVETDDNVEQLFAMTEEKVEQLKQGFAKTDDKVEQLVQVFAKTDDEVEQLKQGFAKTDVKVEQLEQGFAKVEKDMTETGNKVKQLEEAVRSQRLKENKPASAVEIFDVKSCRSKLAQHYKRTATVPTSVWTKKSLVDIHQIYTRLSWVKEEQNPSGSSQSKLAHYTEVFAANKNGVLPKRILVQGQTGIGKSTFVKKLAVDWAELDDEITGDTKNDALTRCEDGGAGHVREGKGATFQDNKDPSTQRLCGKHKDMSETQKESLKKFELVLVVNLKEVSKCPSLREIVHSCSIFPEEETALVDDLLTYITKNQEKVLLVFDGYDEYRCGSNSEIYEIFRGKKLRNCCVLITTRISKADELREFKDVHAEITGFDKVDRVDFMIKVLGSEAEAEELKHHLSRKKLTDLTRVPLLLLFFCTLWKKEKLKSFPENKTKLYFGIVQYVLDYNQGKDSPDRFGKVHDFKEILVEIGKVALECLLKDDHVFEYDQLSDAIRCDGSRIIGLLQVTEDAESLRPAGLVSFIHKSIQEFLSAWYVTYRCVPEGNLGEIEQHARTIEECESVENVFQFVCGLSDYGAVKVLEHLKSVRISDPSLDLSKIIPDEEKETDVPLCDVIERHKRFSKLAYDSFQEVVSKAELLSHCFDCNGGIFLDTKERPLADLSPKLDDLLNLGHSRGVQVIFTFCSMDILSKDSILYKLLKFLDCLHSLTSVTESWNVLRDEDMRRREIRNMFFLSEASFESILCFRSGQCQIYITGVLLRSDASAKLFTEHDADFFSLLSTNLCSEQSCLKFLTSLWCLSGVSSKTWRALGAAIKDCKHLTVVRVSECDDSVCDLLEHVRNTSKCSLEIGSFFKGSDNTKCHLTTAGAVKFSNLLPRFNNIVTLRLDLSNCRPGTLDTLVPSIKHKALEIMELSGISLSPAAAAALGRSLPEMSSLQVLELTGLDGSILEAEKIEALFGGFNKTLPLSRLTLSGFSVRGYPSPLAKSLPFSPSLNELKLENFNMDERGQCSLLQSFGFIPNLKVLKVQSKALRHPCCCTTKVSTGRGYRLGDYKTLELNGISLTQTVAVALGRLLPEMSFLQELELTDVDGSILQVEEMEALFGRCNRMMLLCKLVFSGFKVRGCLAPLTKSFHFFPNLRELKLEKLNMDENDQCGLLESLLFIRNLTVLNIQTIPLGDADFCTAELNTYDYFRHMAYKSLTLKGIILTQAATAALGQSLPKMLSLQALEVTGVGHKSLLQAEEIEALFGRFSGKLPLYSLIVCKFSVTGSIAPLTNSFCFFPNLMELYLAEFDMDEHNLCGLLENLRFVPNLMELIVYGKPLVNTDFCTAKVNRVGGFPLKTLKELALYEVYLTPAVATILGQILPEMSSLQGLLLGGADGSIVTPEGMEALFGGLNKMLPLHHLTCDFNVRGSLAPLMKSFRFLPNLRELYLGGFRGKLNMDEHNLCALLESLRFIPNLKILNVKGRPQGDAHCCTAELNVMASVTHKALEHLRLDGISLTPVSAALLGRSLPEMSSLQELELTGVDGSILQAKEMEPLFGGFNETLPLYRLSLRNFSSRGCLATLCKSFRFFPNLTQLSLEQLNMDEQDVCSLLQNLRFIRSLMALRVQSEDQRDARCYTTKFNTFGSSTTEIHEKLNLDRISLTPAAAVALGRSLPEMTSLQVLEITGRDRRVLQTEEMEALFGGFNKPLPLCELTFSGFSVRGSLAPLIKSLRFYPNLKGLRLESLNMDQHDQCGLLKSFGLSRNLTELSVCVHRSLHLNSFHYSSIVNTFDTLTHGRVQKRVHVAGISLTPAVAALLGQSLPEMSSLQVLQLTQMDRSILPAEEMEALFGGFNKTMQLFQLTLSGFSVRGCLAPLFRSLRFFPKLIELDLEKLNMDEHDLNGLLESFQFIPNLQELRLSGNPLGHSVRCIVPHVINLKKLRFLWIDQTDHSEEDLIYVRDSVQQALPELEIRGGTAFLQGVIRCNVTSW